MDYELTLLDSTVFLGGVYFLVVSDQLADHVTDGLSGSGHGVDHIGSLDVDLDGVFVQVTQDAFDD